MSKIVFFIIFFFSSLLSGAIEVYIPPYDSSDLKRLDNAAWDLLYINPDSALLIADELYELALTKNNLLYQAYAFNTKGIIYDIKSDNLAAISWYEKSLAVYEKMKDKRGIAVANLNIGIIYYNQGIYLKALGYYKKSLKLYEESKDQRGIADAYNNISIIYKTQNQFQESLIYLEKCLLIFKKIKDEQGIAVTYVNMGIVYNLMRDYTKALRYFNLSMDIAKKINDKSIIASNYIQLGFILQQEKSFSEALLNYENALELYKELGNQAGIADVYNNIGSLYNKIDKSELALMECKNGLDLSKQINYLDGIRNNCYCLYEANSISGNKSDALKYYLEYIEARDSLINENMAKEIAHIEFQYKYRQKVMADSIIHLEHEKLTKAKSEAQELEIKNEKTKNIAFGTGIIILLLFGWFMYNRFKVSRKQNEIIAVQKAEVEKQKDVVEEKNKNITDSINYALRIQRSFLPKQDELKNYLGNYFIIYKPKDIVSGDFYWITPVTNSDNNLIVFAVADCTGHGVPGAMMTMIGNTLLNQTIGNETINTPAQALDFLNIELPKNLKKQNADAGIKDGMDIVMCELDQKKKKLYFAGANNSVYLVRNKQLQEFKGNKQAISASDEIEKKQFTNFEIDLQAGDCIYMSTDGMVDQFGGPAGKKFKSAQLKLLLSEVSDLSMNDQEKAIEKSLENWITQGKSIAYEQVDDICILGIRIK